VTNVSPEHFELKGKCSGECDLTPFFGELSEIKPPLAYIRTNLKRDHGVLDFRLADVEEDPAVDVSARVESKETL
jgi:hypothetical protein